MLSTYPVAAELGGAPGPTWIDLYAPTDQEVAAVHEATGLRVPTRADLSEIEATSRLRLEGEALYLSTPLITRSNEDSPHLTPAGFILNRDVLITLRYERVGAFDSVRAALEGSQELCGSDVFTRCLETVVDRAADFLERVGAELDGLSRETFEDPRSTKTRRGRDPLRAKLRALGRLGDRLSQIRDALLGVGRIAPFAAETGKGWIPADVQARLGAVRQDIGSLNDYEGHLSTKVQFLLDAVLGFINIEQNDVVKVLTIASIVGVPPVLVAGVYGMNFKIIPELSWTYGYPYALALMVLSAVLPLVWFRWRGWM